MKSAILFLLGSTLPAAIAQQTVWGQCGGIGWTGPTTCASGSCCTYNNAYYSQCLPSNSCSASSSTTTTTSRTTTTSSRTTTTSSTTTSRTTTSSTTSSTTSTTTSRSTTTSSTTLSTTSRTTTTTSSAAVSTFTNPVVYADYADNDVFKGPDGAFYLSASNMHYSPGAPILRSSDLVNWEPVGHSVPFYDNGDSYNMVGGYAYRGGSWASTLRYRSSNQKWYWIGCMNFWVTFIYTASSPSGPWTKSGVIYGKCYYDCGLLIDDDDKMYVVYGGSTISLAQLTADGYGEASAQVLFEQPSGVTGMEGNRMYKRNGKYIILNDYPSGGATWIWQSSSPWGPWTGKPLHNGVVGPVSGGGSPHQGSLINIGNDNWYFMSFSWAYPAGRMPVLAPIKWGSDGFASLVGDSSGNWGVSYPNPLPTVSKPSWYRTDTFSSGKLGPHWEWNHNPDTSKYSVAVGAVTLSATTITDNLHKARNTLTTRPYGPFPRGTILLDFNNMADGDRTGLSALRDQSAYIGIARSGSTYTLQIVQGVLISEDDFQPTANGTVQTSKVISKGNGQIYLRGEMDARASGSKLCQFSYSTDGTTFTNFGTPYTLYTNWPFFLGYRWGIFNYATKALGGSVKLLSYAGSTWST